MNRWNLIGGAMVAPNPDGGWVTYEDVRKLIAVVREVEQDIRAGAYSAEAVGWSNKLRAAIPKEDR